MSWLALSALALLVSGPTEAQQRIRTVCGDAFGQALPCGGEFQIHCDPDEGGQNGGPICNTGLSPYVFPPFGAIYVDCTFPVANEDFGVCYNCGGIGEPGCLHFPPLFQGCGSGLVRASTSGLSGPLSACSALFPPVDLGPVESAISNAAPGFLFEDSNFTNPLTSSDVPSVPEIVSSTSVCSDAAPEDLSGASRESWGPEVPSSPSRGTVFVIHGRGSSCGNLDGVLNVPIENPLYDRNQLVYCVEYDQLADPLAVRLLPVLQDSTAAGPASCIGTSSCQFDTSNPVVELLAATRSVASVAEAVAEAIGAVPTEGELTLLPHSQGGFIMRALLHRHYDELRWRGKKIARVMSLAHPYYGILVDPAVAAGWVCFNQNNFVDCSVLRWLHGWDDWLALGSGRIDNSDFPQIQWTAIAGDGSDASGMVPAHPTGIPGIQDTCVEIFGGVLRTDVAGDDVVSILSSVGVDEHGFFNASLLSFDETSHVRCNHDANCLLEAALQENPSRVPTASEPRDLVGSGALQFDGDDQVALSHPTAIVLLTMTSNLTLEAWIRPEAENQVVTLLGKSGEYEIGLQDLNGRSVLSWRLSNHLGFGWNRTNFEPPVHEWTHVAFTWEESGGQGAVVYANGARVGGDPDVEGSLGDLQPGVDEFRIGGSQLLPTGPAFVGRMKDVRVWSRTLSNGEVVAGLDADAGSGDLSDLMGWWRFDEEGGDLLLDSSPNALDTTISALGAGQDPSRRTGLQVGRFDRALYFDGIDDYVAVTDPDALSDLELVDQLTIEAWIYPRGPGDPVDGGVILNKEGEYALTRWGDGRITWSLKNTTPGWTSVISGFVAPEHNWTHVAFTYDGLAGLARLYANGIFQQEWVASGSLSDHHPAEDELRIGSRIIGSQPFHGVIDEVRLWDVARSEPDVADNFDKVVPPGAPGLIGTWTFDEEEAGVAFDLATGYHAAMGGGIADRVPSRTDSQNFPGYMLLPEPSGLATLISGLALLLLIERRRSSG